MANTTLMRAIEDSLDPTTVANMIHEIMLDWRSLTINIQSGAPRKTRMKDRRGAIERILGLLLNKHPSDVRTMLYQHFGLGDIS